MKKSISGRDQLKKEDVKQAVIVDYKAIGCRSPGGGACNKPLIQYSLEWLLIEQFDEVFVCCLPDNAQKMRELVSHFLRTENVPTSMKIQVHSSKDNKSTGDCLRDLDAKALIKTDFVIMDVGCCGNLPLAELLEAHKALKKRDKEVILTSVVRNLFTKDPAEIGEFPIYVTDPTSGLLLHYVAGRISSNEPYHPPRPDNKNKRSVLDVPSNIFLERESVKIYTNLCSTNLSIYSSCVPSLYSSQDLCDYHSEADLIRAAFDNRETLGKTVYIHVVDDLFSQRMADFGFVINQKWDQFDTNLIYQRNERCQVLRKLVNDSLIDCARLNSEDYLANLEDDETLEKEKQFNDEDESTDDSHTGSEDQSDEDDSEVSDRKDEENFLREVLESLQRGYEEQIANNNLVLEVNSSKHAWNISIEDLQATLARALLLLPFEVNSNKISNSNEYFNLVNESISKFEEFILNYIKDYQSRETLIVNLEKLYLSRKIEFLNDIVLAKIFYKLYYIEALDEDSIINWFKKYDQKDVLQTELRGKPGIRQLVDVLKGDSD